VVVPTSVFRNRSFQMIFGTGPFGRYSSPYYPSNEEVKKKKTTIASPHKTTVDVEAAKKGFEDYVSRQPVGVQQIIKPEEKPPAVVTIGKKSAGRSDFNLLTIMRDPRKYFEEKISRLPPKNVPDYSRISENIKPASGKGFGYYPSTVPIAEEINLVGQQIGEGEAGLRDIKIFIYDYPKYKKKYEETLNIISSAKTAPSGSAYWFDLNLNKIAEENELFSEPMFQFKGETRLFTKEEAVEKLKSEWSPIEKQYIDLTTGKGKRKVEIGLRKLKETKFTLEEYMREGWKFEKTDEGYVFSQPSAKELHEFLYPGIGGFARTVSIGAMESFPFIAPIRAITAGALSPFTGGKSWGEYETSLYEKSVSLTKKPGEPVVDYTKRFWHPFSESGVGMNVYLPLLLMGTSYVYSGLSAGTVSGGSKIVNALGKIGQTTKGVFIKTGIKTAGYTATAWGVGLTGISFGVAAARTPEQIPSMLGYTLQGVAQAAGGWTLGKYLHGQGMPKIGYDAQGRIKTSTKTLYKDLTFETTSEGKIRFYRTGEIETTVFGEKPGTYIKTSSTFRLKGQAQIIGEQIVATRIEGITVKGSGEIFGKTYRSSQIQKMIQTGKISLVETYGFSKKIPSKLPYEITFDKSVSGIYGKSPEVITSKGVSFFKELETGIKNISLETKTGKIGGIDFKIEKPVNVTFGKHLGYSIGSFESSNIVGFYQDIGFTYMIKGVSPGLRFFKTGGPSIQTLSQGGMGSLKVMSIKGETVQKTGIGKTVTMGGKIVTSGKTLFLPVQSKTGEQTIAYGSKAVSFMEMKTPSITNGGVFLVGTLISLPKTFQRKKQGGLISQIEEVQSGRKNIMVHGFKPEMETSFKHQFSFMDTGQELGNKRIQNIGLFRGSVLKIRQLTTTKLTLFQKMETISLVKMHVPSITTPFVPSPFPPLFRGKGDYEPGIKTKRGVSWGGFGKKRLSLKVVLADPFSVMESQIRFGKATHPKPTKEVWLEAEKTGWRLGTVELRKSKKLKMRPGKIFDFKIKKRVKNYVKKNN